MTSITSKLSKDLRISLKTASEIWIAVGLLNLRGLDWILKAIPARCKINVIVGVDLPTDPKALSKLLALKTKRYVNIRILIDEFFHPKVYIMKSERQFIAIVGSANCTIGGLENNIEMSIQTKDNGVCKKLISWYEKDLLTTAEPLTSEFIKNYEPKYEKRIKRRKQEKIEINKFKGEENNKIEAFLKNKREFITKLKRFRKSKQYNEYKRQRNIVVTNLRKSLDYPNFKKIDLNKFFSIKDLGTIIPIKVKAKINRNRKKFSSLMKFICDESIPLNERMEEALNGKISIKFIGEGFISKVLVMHRPKLYYVHNDAFIEIFKPFGLTLPRGLSSGEKYQLTRDALKEIMKETNIDDFATLDQCIWMLKK